MPSAALKDASCHGDAKKFFATNVADADFGPVLDKVTGFEQCQAQKSGLSTMCDPPSPEAETKGQVSNTLLPCLPPYVPEMPSVSLPRAQLRKWHVQSNGSFASTIHSGSLQWIVIRHFCSECRPGPGKC